MQFEHLDDLRRHFGVAILDVDELRRELRNRQAALHPDRTSGTFTDASAQQTYHELDSAVCFLDGVVSSGTAMVPANQMTDLVTSIRDLTRAREDESRVGRLQRNVQERLDSFRGSFIGTRITVTAVTALLTALWVFPKTLSENPIISQYKTPDYSFLTALWLCALASTAALWIVTCGRDAREKRFRAHLGLESYQNALFDEFLKARRNHPLASHTEFSKDDLVFFLGNPRHLVLASSVRPTRIDLDLAQKLSDLVIDRAVTRGIIVQDTGKSMSERYVYQYGA